MTRQCMFCNAPMGEKCMKCGNEDVVWGQEDELYYCRPCDRHFFEGEGGITSGACDACLTKAKQELAGGDKEVSSSENSHFKGVDTDTHKE